MLEDTLVISISTFFGLFSSTFDTSLKELLPDYERVGLRSPLFRSGLEILLLGMSNIIVFHRIASAVMVGLTLSIIGLAFSAAGFKRVEYVRFVLKSGKPGLDIGRTGTDVDRFERFINAVQEQIVRSCACE